VRRTRLAELKPDDAACEVAAGVRARYSAVSTRSSGSANLDIAIFAAACCGTRNSVPRNSPPRHANRPTRTLITCRSPRLALP